MNNAVRMVVIGAHKGGAAHARWITSVPYKDLHAQKAIDNRCGVTLFLPVRIPRNCCSRCIRARTYVVYNGDDTGKGRGW